MVQVSKKSLIQDLVANRAPRSEKVKLSREDQLVIIWGVYRGWSTNKIASTIPATRATVLNYQREWDEQPALILQLPVLIQISKDVFRCNICEETRSTETKIYRHVIAHIVPTAVAMYTPLRDFKRL